MEIILTLILVNDYKSEAGNISFKFSYKIKEGMIAYKFYDFKHDGEGTAFYSIGNIPEKWNHEVGKIFTEKQYSEIMTDVYLNSANAVRLIKKYCVN